MILGKNIQLRPATLDDRRRIFEWLTQSDLTSKMMGEPHFPDCETPDWEYFVQDYNPHFFDDLHPDNGRSYIILAQGEEVGHINYNEIDRSNNSVELDIWLAGSQCTGKGYGSDAINTLCTYLHQYLKCQTFILAPSARNEDAIRAYKKCGFVVSNEIPSVQFVPDYDDTVIMLRRITE